MKCPLCIPTVGLVVILIGSVCWGRGMGSTLTVVSTPSTVQQAKEQTVSGRVTSVGDDSFTVEVGTGGEPNRMEFVTDKDTEIDGRLEVGAKVHVTYRTKNGKNVAIRITALD